MKKLLSIVLAAILALCCMSVAFAADSAVADGSFGAYDHVFILGVDGAGRFFRDAETPNFDRIFKDGAIDYTARAEMITVSAQNWGSILGGVSYLRHGLTNGKVEATERSSDTQYPTIFTYTRRAFPDAELASFANWSAINVGHIENDLNVTKTTIGDDEQLTDAICEYFSAGNAPKLFFTQFDSVDHVGHEFGSKAPEFFAQIELIDGCIGRIYDALVRQGLMDNGLFIVVADHGHTVKGGHGGLTMRETNVTVAVAGKTVVAGGTLDKHTRNRDVAAIALYALGVERAQHMSACVPANLFRDVAGERRSIRYEIPDTILSGVAWIITRCTAWI